MQAQHSKDKSVFIVFSVIQLVSFLKYTIDVFNPDTSTLCGMTMKQCDKSSVKRFPLYSLFLFMEYEY